MAEALLCACVLQYCLRAEAVSDRLPAWTDLQRVDADHCLNAATSAALSMQARTAGRRVLYRISFCICLSHKPHLSDAWLQTLQPDTGQHTCQDSWRTP